MKLHYTLFLIVLLFQTGCGKDEIEGEVPEWSKVSVQKNGQLWETRTVAINNKTGNIPRFSIQANMFDEYGWSEALDFGNINLKVGQQSIILRTPHSPIDTTYSSYMTLQGGDAIKDRFVLLEDEENYIDIQSIDTANSDITGTFQVSFVRNINYSVTNESLPDTIRFTEGEFRLKLVTRD